MSNVVKCTVLFLLVTVTCLAYAEPTPPVDPTTFPKNGSIHTLKVVDYTFPFSDLTNCYIIAGKTGEAIIVDPADELEPVTDKATGQALTRILADKETGESKVIKAQDLANYKVIKANAYGDPTIVEDPENGKAKYVYDQFRTTNTFGPKIVQYLTDHHLTLKYIVVTHGHLDHFGALTYLKEKTGARVLMHINDLRALDGKKLEKDKEKELVGYPKDAYRIIGITTKVDQPLKDNDIISLDGMVFQVIHTPGHSPGSICLRTRQGNKTILISGDTLLHWGYFRDVMGNILYDNDGKPMTANTGRTNFLDGSGDEIALNDNIREKLYILPDDTVVYPGHNDPTTIGEEKKACPHLKIPEAKEKNP